MGRKKKKTLIILDLTPAQILSLARDVAEGKIFGSWMINGCSKQVVEKVFYPVKINPQHTYEIGLFDERYTNQDAIVQVFEYVKKQTRNRVGPYPLFLTCYGLKRKFAITLSNAIKGIQMEISNEK